MSGIPLCTLNTEEDQLVLGTQQLGIELRGLLLIKQEQCQELLVWLDAELEGRSMDPPLFMRLDRERGLLRHIHCSSCLLEEQLEGLKITLRGPLSELQAHRLQSWLRQQIGRDPNIPAWRQPPVGRLKGSIKHRWVLHMPIPCPDCGALVDPLGLAAHRRGNPCEARQLREDMRCTHLEVDRWQYGISPHVSAEHVTWSPGSQGTKGRWTRSFWVPKGPKSHWCNDHGITVLRLLLNRRLLKQSTDVARRFGASASAQLQGSISQ